MFGNGVQEIRMHLINVKLDQQWVIMYDLVHGLVGQIPLHGT